MQCKMSYSVTSMCENKQTNKQTNKQKAVVSYVIGERSEPPSDKLGGEIFNISSHTLVCLSLYIYCTYSVTTNTMPTRISVCMVTLIPDIAQRKPNNNRN